MLTSKRQETISDVIKDLELLKNNSKSNQYAIDENIAFFEAIKSIFGYIKWLITRAPKIDSEKLLEINDLLPGWDLTMHRKLMEIERREFPGLIAPLVKRLFEIISTSNKLMILANIGCGGMEVERQLISNLIARKHNDLLVFMGVDRSPTTGQLIKENFKDLFDKVEFYEVDILDSQGLREVIKKQEKQFLVLLCKNDIFELDKYFTENIFDLSFSALFKHHLSSEGKNSLDRILSRISRRFIEYDGYLSWPHLVVPHTIVAWNDPIFLNASIFSDLRYFRKKQLKSLHEIEKNWEINIFRVGTYLIECYKLR